MLKLIISITFITPQANDRYVTSCQTKCKKSAQTVLDKVDIVDKVDIIIYPVSLMIFATVYNNLNGQNFPSVTPTYIFQ